MTYAYPGEFDRTISSASFFGAVAGLGLDHSSRLTNYNLYYDYYTGSQWDVAIPEGFEQVTVNYIESFVSKIKRFTFRNGWTMTFPTELQEMGVADWLTKCWKYNGKDELTRILTEYAGIFGDWFLYVQWLPNPTGLDKYKYRNVRLTALDPRYVYPEYNELTNEIEFCTILIPYTKKTLVDGSIRYKSALHKETHTKSMIYIQDIDEKGNETSFEQIKNPLNKILIIHGKNVGFGSSNFGKSDVASLIEMQKLINEKLSDVSEIIAYHAAPVTIIKGARTRQLEKGANKIWAGIPVNGDVYNLKSEANIDGSMNFVNWLKVAMHELGQVPEDALGGKRGISNTSAVALALDYEPLIEIADEKRFYFEQGIRHINNLILELAINRGILPEEILYELDDKEIDIEFGSLLPRDRAKDLEELGIELQLNLETRRGALVRLGCSDPDKKLKEIEEEHAKSSSKQDTQEYATPIDSNNELDNDAIQKAINSNRIIHGEQVVRQNERQQE